MKAKHNPPNYQRATLTRSHLREALRNRGWVGLTELVGLVADEIAPENAVRFYEFYYQHQRGARRTRRQLPLSELIARGLRAVVVRRMYDLARSSGNIDHQKYRPGREPRYRLREEPIDAQEKSRVKQDAT